MVMRVRGDVATLLDPAAAAPGSSPDHFRARHQLHGSFSANLHCEPSGGRGRAGRLGVWLVVGKPWVDPKR
jgi:hypothetical protein